MRFTARPRNGSVGDLRTRYTPRSRLGHGLMGLSPWINLVLLIVFFWMLNGRLVLQPGVTAELPEAPFTGGARSGMVVVALSVKGPGPREDLVFFNDERFALGVPREVEKFKQAMANHLRGERDATLIVQADRDVPHGTVVALMELAREVGVRHVNVATRPK